MGNGINQQTGQVHPYCMSQGTIVGVLCALSFLCAMYGISYSLLSLLSNMLGVLAVFVAGWSIRSYSNKVKTVRYWQACKMAMVMFFYAILLTAMIQYIYFAFLDGGRLGEQMQTIFSLPEYRHLLEQMANGRDTDELQEEVLGIFNSPRNATLQLIWMNIFTAFIFTPVVALIGITGKKMNGDK